MLKKTILSLAIGWTFLILILCLVNFNDLPKVKVSGADKYGHFTFHLVFTLLWSYHFWLNQNYITLRQLGYIVFASLCFGILIEFLQDAFTKTRQADSLDVLANFSGALVGFFIFLVLKKVGKS